MRGQLRVLRVDLPEPRNQEDDSRPEGAGSVNALEGLQRYSELVNNAFVSVSQKMISLLGSGKQK